MNDYETQYKGKNEELLHEIEFLKDLIQMQIGEQRKRDQLE